MADFTHSLGFDIASENLVEPAKYKGTGFPAGYMLPAPHFNWFLDKTSKCVAELQSTLNAIETRLQSAVNIRNLHTYTSLAQIGLSGAVTMTDIFTALNTRGEQCMLVLGNTNAEGQGSYVSDVPTQFGTLVVIRYAAARTMALFFKADDGNVHQYMGKYHSTLGWSGWFETFTEAHPPTPDEVGALSTAGGTVTGDVTISNGNFAVTRAGGTSRVFNHATSPVTYLQQVTPEGKIIELALNAETNTFWLAMGEDANSLTWYKVYTEANIPTLAELGAQATHYYYDPAHFGCNTSSTLSDVWTNLPNMSVFVFSANNMSDESWNLPDGFGIIRLEKFNVNRGSIHYYTKDNAYPDLRMYLNNADGSPTGVWVKMYDEAHKPLLTDLSGVLPPEKGGTGKTSLTDTTVGYSLHPVMINCSNTDINTLKTAGFYFGYENMTNAAVENEISVFEVMPYSTDWILQTQTRLTDGKSFFRYFYSGSSWSDWFSYYSSKHKPTPADIGAATSGHGHALTDSAISGTLPISKGGTGATDVTNARKNLNFISGNYTGTGKSGSDSEMYKYDTGARGSNVLIINGNSYRGFLTPTGGWMTDNSNGGWGVGQTFGNGNNEKAFYEDGYIMLRTTKEHINGNGYTYWFYCL